MIAVGFRYQAVSAPRIIMVGRLCPGVRELKEEGVGL